MFKCSESLEKVEKIWVSEKCDERLWMDIPRTWAVPSTIPRACCSHRSLQTHNLLKDMLGPVREGRHYTLGGAVKISWPVPLLDFEGVGSRTVECKSE